MIFSQLAKTTFTFLVIAAIAIGLLRLQFLKKTEFLTQAEISKVSRFPQIKFLPQNVNNLPPPKLSASAILVVDLNSDTLLFEKNSNLKVVPASLTKLATAILVLEKCQPDQIITVPQIATPPGTKVGLVKGERISVENLLYGLLLPSGNDAANVLSITCYSSFDHFLSSMTNLTQKLNMINTQFNNPSGLPAKNQFTTAADLLKLTKTFLVDQRLSAIVSTREKIVTDVSGKISHKLVNLNKLLENPKVLGVKTGTTVTGENLITLKGDNSQKIVVILLQSQDRFGETQEIFGWIEQNFRWQAQIIGE